MAPSAALFAALLACASLGQAASLQWNPLEAATTTGCKGSNNKYSANPSYGVASTQWGHLPRGGWRGAVLGPKGDKIYGIPTNATSVRGPSRASLQRASSTCWRARTRPTAP